jgi:hypothetical protein
VFELLRSPQNASNPDVRAIALQSRDSLDFSQRLGRLPPPIKADMSAANFDHNVTFSSVGAEDLIGSKLSEHSGSSLPECWTPQSSVTMEMNRDFHGDTVGFADWNVHSYSTAGHETW